MATIKQELNGIVAAGDPQSAAAGAEMYALGGNAFDAAVAAAFAACVAESVIVNISGGGMATWYDSQTKQIQSLDFFSTMPSGPLHDKIDFREVVLDFGSTTQSFFIGRASVAVPGIVPGLTKLLAQSGRLPLRTVLQPAIRLAKQGAILSEGMDYILRLLRDIFTDTPQLAAIYAPDGQLKQAGEAFQMPQFAETLEQLATTGASLFSTGEIAQAIVQDQVRNGGLVTSTDLRDYSANLCTPISVPYRDTEVHVPPPSSTGGVLIAFALKLLNAVELTNTQPDSVARIRALTEVMRLTSQARETWETLTGSDAERIAAFLDEHYVDGYRKQLRQNLSRRPSTGQASEVAPNHTTHISTVDSEENFVSITMSAGENAGYLVGDTGVSLNNMLGEIDLHPLGFHKMPAGQRIATMMSPAIVTQAGTPMLALGSGGSTRIRSAILQLLNLVIDHNFSVEAATNASRIHFENNVLHMEPGFSIATTTELLDLQYTLNQWPNKSMYFGGAQVVHYSQRTGFSAAGDFRRGGAIASKSAVQ